MGSAQGFPTGLHAAARASGTNGTGRAAGPATGDGTTPAFSLEGLVRDERGVRLAPEVDD
jgi:hypothetical protein